MLPNFETRMEVQGSTTRLKEPLLDMIDGLGGHCLTDGGESGVHSHYDVSKVYSGALNEHGEEVCADHLIYCCRHEKRSVRFDDEFMHPFVTATTAKPRGALIFCRSNLQASTAASWPKLESSTSSY